MSEDLGVFVGKQSWAISIAEHVSHQGTLHQPYLVIPPMVTFFFSGMANPKNFPDYQGSVKGAKVLRTNYSFLWQYLEPSQEFQSRLVEKSFMTEADRVELNCYEERSAQAAVIIHRVLFSNCEPLSLLDDLTNTGQGHITNKLKQGT